MFGFLPPPRQSWQGSTNQRENGARCEVPCRFGDSRTGSVRYYGELRRLKRARPARAAKLAMQSDFDASHMAPVLWTRYARTVRCTGSFCRRRANKGKETLKSFPAAAETLSDSRTPPEADSGRSTSLFLSSFQNDGVVTDKRRSLP